MCARHEYVQNFSKSSEKTSKLQIFGLKLTEVMHEIIAKGGSFFHAVICFYPAMRDRLWGDNHCRKVINQMTEGMRSATADLMSVKH